MSGIAGVHGSLDSLSPASLNDNTAATETTTPETTATEAAAQAADPIAALTAAQRHRREATTSEGRIGEGTGVRVRFDGRLVDTEPLKAELDAAGHPVAPDATDADLALITYLAFGTEGLGRLPGTWALAITDPRDETTRLAVDAAGAGSLAYAVVGTALVYASEPSALVTTGAAPAKADDATVREFLLHGRSDTTDHTFFAGVHAVRAGQVVTFMATGTEPEVASYPQPETSVEQPGLAVKTAVRRYEGENDMAVRLAYGIGGAVLAEAAGDQGTPYRITTGPTTSAAGRDDDEAGVARALGKDAVSVEATGDTLGDVLTDFVRLVGEPVADAAAYATLAVAESAAKDGRTTLVDPLGIDEVLSVRIADAKAKKHVDVSTLVSGDSGDSGENNADNSGDAGTRASVSGAAQRIADRVTAHTGVRVVLPYFAADVRAALATSRDGDGAQPALTALAEELPAAVRTAAGQLRAGAPAREWLLRLKNRVYGEFLSESFTLRPWFRQQDVLVAFEDFINGRNADAAIFWRFLLVELWAREFLDEKRPESAAPRVKGPLEANEGKQLEIDVDGEKWIRFPVRTELFSRGDDYATLISGYARDFLAAVVEDGRYTDRFDRPWYLLVSEKVIAIAQGRSYFIWDIQPTWWARTLSKYVVKTPYGIGLGSPWTMQLAIQEAGLPRILAASAAGAAGKVIGRRGLFYQVAGHAVRAIDGPTEYSAYPSNVSAKLAPASPHQVAKDLAPVLKSALSDAGYESAAEQLSGVVVIDANDIGRNILGLHADRDEKFFENLFADNPLGQGSEQTPISVAVSADNPTADNPAADSPAADGSAEDDSEGKESGQS